MTINLKDAYNKIISTNFSHNNNFNVMFTFGNNYANLGMPNEYKTIKNSLETNGEDVYIDNSTMPQLVSSPIENYIDHRMFATSNYFSSSDVTIRFNDHDTMSLYRFFTAYFICQRYNYPNDYYFSVSFIKLKDNTGEKDTQIVRYDNCLITNISSIDFSNANSTGVLLPVEITIHTTKSSLLGSTILATTDV